MRGPELGIRVGAAGAAALLLAACSGAYGEPRQVAGAPDGSHSGHGHAAPQSGVALAPASAWQLSEYPGEFAARHEAGWVEFKGKLYLLGGRGMKPVDIYDPVSKSWQRGAMPPFEMHHFQPVVLGDAIYIIGAMEGRIPDEVSLPHVWRYLPHADRFEQMHEIPAERRRGGGGVALHEGKFYFVGGNTNGHIDGHQPWLDRYDPVTGSWEVLPDAPHSRDHFHAVIIGNELYAMGGRRSERATGNLFSLTVEQSDVFDLAAGVWRPADEARNIPTPRAGTMSTVLEGKIIIAGGESGTQQDAHNEVDVFDPAARTWQKWPALVQGRHGAGIARVADELHLASGSGQRGGRPELESVETLTLIAKPSGD